MKTKLLSTLTSMAVALAALGCTNDEIPSGLKRTPDGDGNMVRFDLYHKPLPEIPLPNDAAMWPDPTSRTGLRVNASLVAPTSFERVARQKFDTLEGWGTYSAFTVGFDKRDPNDSRPAIDLDNIIARHQGDDFEFENDGIYVINLDTGVPVPIDMGDGVFQYIVREKNKYWRNDSRATETVLLFETADETIDPATGKFDPARTVDGTPNGIPIYKPEWDTDFDGVLDRPNLLDPTACPNQEEVLLGEVEDHLRDQCVADNLLTWYERETDTLTTRPLIPLDERTRYAVVVTDRVVDPDGDPVMSPFDFVYHPTQEDAAKSVRNHLSNPALSTYYGDIGGTGLERVAFMWSFTTAPVVEDLRLVRDGLYGTGPFSYLAKRFPAEVDMQRALGLVTADALENGATEEPNWPEDPRCKELYEKGYYIVELDRVRDFLRTLASQGFGVNGPSLEALLQSFEAISHLAVGFFKTPFFISGGPKGTDPNASFNVDFRTGEGEVHEDIVQFLLAVPKETAEHKQPFPISYYGHGYTSSTIESLGFAGVMAQQGLASVGMNASFHGLQLGEAEEKLAKALFPGACLAPFGDAMLAGRHRDLDGDPVPDSGGDYWTSYLFHTRDVVRQSAIDQLQMFRIFKSFDGKTMSKQDYNQDGTPDLAGDFDTNGVPDVGGRYYAWGQSLGGILSPFLGALDWEVTATAPTAGAAGLLDVGARTFQGGAFEGIYLRNFGPLVVGVPASELNEGQTACGENQLSVRFVVLSVNNDVEVEISCVDANTDEGGTVYIYNYGNGERRCARMAPDGRFRIGVPSSVGDRLEIQMYDEPDAVDSYDWEEGCNLTVGEDRRFAVIREWGPGTVARGAPDPTGLTDDIVCDAEGGCHKFEDKYYEAGAPLVAIVEGMGHIRQTPSLRRFMNLATNVIDPGDPANFLPFYSVRTMLDPWGNPHPPTGMLNIATVGDMNVPLNAGIAMGRVAGAIPFMRPDAPERYPHYADYAMPAELYAAQGSRTANSVLADTYVLEGINRLRRHAPSDLTSCRRNQRPVTEEDVLCHPNCSGDDSSSCLGGQVCVNDRCVAAPVSENDCSQFLYDVDVIDEGRQLYGEAEASTPLRMARIAMPADPSSPTSVWEPRLMGVPFSSDEGAWVADRRVVAQLMAYVEGKGTHGFDNTDPCENWSSGRYYTQLIGRFFRSDGADIYYLSHPTTHHCLAYETGSANACSFVTMP